jgi:serine/threonine protein kinase
MNISNICLGCMEEKGPESICQQCGYEAGSEAESLLHLPPGTMLQDKYLVGRVLGQGGFGITYLALDTTLHLKLAIKEYLPQELATRSLDRQVVTAYKADLNEQFKYGLARFLEEARILARFVEHPNVISVRDYFEANGTAYLVMNYLEGLTLENYLSFRGGRIPVEEALAIFMPVLDALKEVHQVGILHRDISPDNLLIDNRGRVTVIDFGAARQEVRGKSKMLSVILKAGYAPEEQHRSRGEQGPWTDIYAVSATIYRAITGEKPPEAIDRLAEDVLIIPSMKGIEISGKVEKVLFKGLAVRASDRFQNVSEFQQAFIDAQAESSTAIPEKYKNCPYCGEEIHRRAVKCKYCYSIIGSEDAIWQTKGMKDYDDRNLENTNDIGSGTAAFNGEEKAKISSTADGYVNNYQHIVRDKLPNTKNNRQHSDSKSNSISGTPLTALFWHKLQKEESVASIIALLICILLAVLYIFASLGVVMETNNYLALALSVIAIFLSIIGLTQSKNKKALSQVSLFIAIALLAVSLVNLSDVSVITDSNNNNVFTPELSSDDHISVPGDYSKIQNAIDSAINGDVIIVEEGTYKENIDFKGK